MIRGGVYVQVCWKTAAEGVDRKWSGVMVRVRAKIKVSVAMIVRVLVHKGSTSGYR